jgi:AbrB family looped-hinge helix DNA binding protein
MRYVTLTDKGQITVPVEFRRTLGLTPGRKLNVSLNGNKIIIQKPEVLDEVRQLLQAEMKAKGTSGEKTKSGAGWTAHVKEKYGKP